MDPTSHHLPTVRVIARVRPALKPPAVGSDASLTLLNRTTLQVTQLEKNTLKRGLRPGEPPTRVIYKSTQPFAFDRVYWTTDSTEVLHAREVEPLVSAVLSGDGTTALCLAYGQTGSGKTHTLTGGSRGAGGLGVLQMAAEQLMASVAAGNGAGHAGRYVAYVTAGEIYMENLLDLASDGGKARKLTAATLHRVPVVSGRADELTSTLEALARRRAEGATNKNEHSSRSHAVYCIHLEYRVPRNPTLLLESPPPACLEGGAPESADVSVLPVGTFGIVDLAGAEYAEATEGRDGERRLEGGRNNLGLMSLKAAFRHLGECSSILARGGSSSSFPPFSWSRSTLTRILRPFFTTPGSRLLMLVTASPENVDAAQTAQALAEGVTIAGRSLAPRNVVEVGPAPPPTTKGGGTASARAGTDGRAPRPILRAGSGRGGGRDAAAARAVQSAVGGRR